jgi:hypothetical protein
MEYRYETKRLFANIDFDDELNGVEKCWIAGGSVRNVFTNTMNEFNDYDLYFGSKNDLVNFLYNIESSNRIVLDKTDKSLTIKWGKDGPVVQVIFFKFFESAEEIFNTFDFYCVMGAYNLIEDKFELHPEFLKDNAARVLRFNENTAFPIMSMIRVFKYEKKGYTISKPELVRILLRCMSLKIETFDELKKQIGGMYGEAFENMVIEDSEFSYEKVLDSLKELSYSDDAFFNKNENADANIDNYYKFVNDLLGIKNRYFKFNDCFYSIRNNDLDQIYNVDNEEEIPCPIEPTIVYKWVKKTKDGKYFSYYDTNFEYKIGETIKPKNSSLYFAYIPGIKTASYYNNDDNVALECIVDVKNVRNYKGLNPGGSIEVSECFVVREISKKDMEILYKEVMFGLIPE